MFNTVAEKELRNKLIILMLMNDLDTALQSETIIDLALESELIEYIDLQHYLSELKEQSMIHTKIIDGKLYNEITEDGRVAIEFFRVRIPEYIQEKINKIVKQYMKSLPVKTTTEAKYTNINDVFSVELMLYKNNEIDFYLKFNVDTEKEAIEMCKNFNSDYEKKIRELLLQ